jgi:hypothetical protein
MATGYELQTQFRPYVSTLWYPKFEKTGGLDIINTFIDMLFVGVLGILTRLPLLLYGLITDLFNVITMQRSSYIKSILSSPFVTIMYLGQDIAEFLFALVVIVSLSILALLGLLVVGLTDVFKPVEF